MNCEDFDKKIEDNNIFKIHTFDKKKSAKKGEANSIRIIAVRIMDDLEVEVGLENGNIDQAFVTDVFHDSVQIVFEQVLCNYRKTTISLDNFHCVKWLPQYIVDFDLVKLPRRNIKREFFVNQEVEVLAESSNNGPIGYWRKAVIKFIKKDFHAVKYTDCENTETDFEIVLPNRLRHVNSNPTIDSNTFFKFEIDVPDKLRDSAKKLEDAHKLFKKAINASICRYVPNKGKLIVISRCSRSENLANMMKDMHFYLLSQQMVILQQAVGNLNSTELRNLRGSYVEFQIQKDVMCFATGVDDCNVELARRVKGVTRIELEEASCTFKIYGQTREAVEEARKILEYKEDSVIFPYDYIIEGTDTESTSKTLKKIIEILDKTNCKWVTVVDSIKRQYHFIFRGPVENTSNAKAILEYFLAHLKEIEEIKKELNQILLRRI